MKKLTLCTIALSSVFSVGANAESSIDLSGTVAPVCTISSDTVADFGDVTSLQTATIQLDMECNDRDGATIKFTSINGGLKAIDPSGEVEKLRYTAEIDSIQIFQTNKVDNSVYEKIYTGSELVDGVSKDLVISTIDTSKWAGSYNDLIQIDITAK